MNIFTGNRGIAASPGMELNSSDKFVTMGPEMRTGASMHLEDCSLSMLKRSGNFKFLALVAALVAAPTAATEVFASDIPGSDRTAETVFHVSLTYPMGGEVLTAGSVIQIEWIEIQTHNMTNWDVFYSTDGGTVFRAIKYDLPDGTNSYQWIVPDIATTQAQIRVIQDNDQLDYTATSPNFTIRSVSTDIETADELPTAPKLFANFPNPFSSETEIRFAVPSAGHVQIEVFDAMGRRIALLVDRRVPAGFHEVEWNAETIPSGMYFSILRADDRISISKMVVIR
jgi:hypothetical protein